VVASPPPTTGVAVPCMEEADGARPGAQHVVAQGHTSHGWTRTAGDALGGEGPGRSASPNSLVPRHTGQCWASKGMVGAVRLGPRGRGATAGAVESGDPFPMSTSTAAAGIGDSVSPRPPAGKSHPDPDSDSESEQSASGLNIRLLGMLLSLLLSHLQPNSLLQRNNNTAHVCQFHFREGKWL